MSADPTPPPPPEPPSSAPTPEGTLPPQKRRYKRPEPSDENPPAADDPDSEIIILSSLLQNLLARKQSNEASETEGEVRAKVNRFSLRGTPPAGAAIAASTVPLPVSEAPPPPAAGPASLPPPVAQPEADGPEGMSAIAFPKFEPRTFQPQDLPDGWQRNGSTWGRGVLYFAFAALLALLAFLAGRSNVRPVAAPGVTPAPATLISWKNPALEALDRALAADRAGDLESARRIVSELAKEPGANPMLDAYGATVNTRLGRTNDVEASLSRKIGPNTPAVIAAVLNAAQGFNYTRRREFEQAVDCFSAVAQVQPFDVLNLQHLAESQRRAGRLTQAVETFQLAMLRLPNGVLGAEDEREYLAFKQRLSLIEIGQEEKFRAELTQHLGLTPPAPYWLLTSAALALQKNDLPAAAAALQRAQAALPSLRFAALMDDYFFRPYARRPELIAFLTESSAERIQARYASMEHFIDP